MRNRGPVALILVAALGCASEGDKKTSAVPPEAKIGKPLPLGKIQPIDLAADPIFLFWTNSAGTLKRANHDGTSMALLANDGGISGSLALDELYVYWTTNGGFVRVKKTGGAIEKVAEFNAQAADIAASDGKLYFTDYDKGRVMVGTAAPDAVEAAEFVTGEKHPQAILADKDNVYWTSNDRASPSKDGAIRKASRAGGGASSLAENQFGPTVLCMDDANVYWAMPAGAGDALATAPKAGGEVKVLATGVGDVTSCVVDDHHVYVSDARGVKRVEKTGGKLVEFGKARKSIGTLVQDATTLYWNEYSGGQIVKLEKL